MSREVSILLLVSVGCFLSSAILFFSAYGAWRHRDEQGNVKVYRGRVSRALDRPIEVPAHSEFACPSVLLIAAVVAGYYAWKWHREDSYGDWNL
jgi:hypothetical protein